jgi:hypothetical protein
VCLCVCVVCGVVSGVVGCGVERVGVELRPGVSATISRVCVCIRVCVSVSVSLDIILLASCRFPGQLLALAGRPPAVQPAFVVSARCCVRGNLQARLREVFQLLPTSRLDPA